MQRPTVELAYWGTLLEPEQQDALVRGGFERGHPIFRVEFDQPGIVPFVKALMAPRELFLENSFHGGELPFIYRGRYEGPAGRDWHYEHKFVPSLVERVDQAHSFRPSQGWDGEDFWTTRTWWRV